MKGARREVTGRDEIFEQRRFRRDAEINPRDAGATPEGPFRIPHSAFE